MALFLLFLLRLLQCSFSHSLSLNQVSLEDLYNGKTSKLALQKTVLCTGCAGEGGKKGSLTLLGIMHLFLLFLDLSHSGFFLDSSKNNY